MSGLVVQKIDTEGSDIFSEQSELMSYSML